MIVRRKTEIRAYEVGDEIPDWLENERARGNAIPTYRDGAMTHYVVRTPGGNRDARPGDYIVRDEAGDLYVYDRYCFSLAFADTEKEECSEATALDAITLELRDIKVSLRYIRAAAEDMRRR